MAVPPQESGQADFGIPAIAVGTQVDLLVFNAPPEPLDEHVVTPGAFAVHWVAESVKHAPEEVPAHRNGALTARSDDPAACSEAGGVTERHARHEAVSDSDDFCSKVYAFDPHFLADRGIDTSDVKAETDDALHAA